MDTGVIKLSLLSRSLGPSCSNVELFFLGQRRRLYRAYGVPGGAVLVQRLPVSKGDHARETVITEIVIDGVQSPSTNRIEDVQFLSYSQGPNCFLATSTAEYLFIYSLKQFDESDPGKTPVFSKILDFRFTGITVMSWTAVEDGLIVCDSKGQISCVGVTVQQRRMSLEPLARRSIMRSDPGNIEVLWVQRMPVPYTAVTVGNTCQSIYTVRNSDQMKLLQPDGHFVQTIHGERMTCGVWSRHRSVNGASMRPCLLTAGFDGSIRVWSEEAKATAHLGSSTLSDKSSNHRSNHFAVQVVLEQKHPRYVPGTMQACWVDPIRPVHDDPRVSWIVSTYLVDQDGRLREHCSIHAVYGLPVDLEGTPLSYTDSPNSISASTDLGEQTSAGTYLRAAMLRTEPSPMILLAEAAGHGDSAETRSVLIDVQQSEKGGLRIEIENASVSEIVGFTSSVSQLVTHPWYDCVAVLTASMEVSVWDLWPVRKLCDLAADETQIGGGVATLCWLDLNCREGELGHILLIGNKGLSVYLIQADHLSGKPRASPSPLSTCFFEQPLSPSSLTLLGRSVTEEVASAQCLLRTEETHNDFYKVSINQRGDQVEATIQAISFHPAVQGMTGLDRIRNETGGIVIGTTEGTLEFYRDSDDSLIHQVSCRLSTKTDQDSFISCVATCSHAPYIACVTSFDRHQNEDKLHILQSQSMLGSLEYKLEDSFVSPSGTISRMSWGQSPSPFLTLVVGYQAGQVDVFVRKRQGVWTAVAKYVSSLELITITTTKRGLPVVGSENHMLFLSSDSHAVKDDSLDKSSIMQAALSVGGPLPDYHQTPLLTLLQLGHLQSIGSALNEMAEFLKAWQETPENERLEGVYSPTINGPYSLLSLSLSDLVSPNLRGVTFGEKKSCVAFQKRGDFIIKQPPKKEEPVDPSGLMTGQFDMSQFGGFGFGIPAAVDPREKPADVKDSSTNGVSGPEPEEEEECVLLSVDSSFEDQCRDCLTAAPSTQVDLDEEYLRSVLEKYIAEEDGLPLDRLLLLSKTGAGLLSDVLGRYSTWATDLSRSSLDLPGRKFLAAVKLVPLSAKAQPKKSETNLKQIKKGDYVSPFLKTNSMASLMTAISVASDQSSSSSSVVDQRLTESYVSWPERAGIAVGIEAIHILWALESRDPGPLLEACLSATMPDRTGPYSWESLRSIGAGFWIRSKETAVVVAEEVAKEQFKRKNDPHDCALMYIALGKQRLLGRLFRTNAHSKVADLLAKDFSVERNRQAAAKNAFVLLGQHRHSLAAAFFLVGGYTEDALGVCAKEMGDPQLAMFLSTLLESADVQLIRKIIEKDILPYAVESDDRVAQGMLSWLMGDKIEALKSITTVKALKSELSISDRAVSKILLLQFVISRGLPELKDRYVPLWMVEQISNVAAHCIHVLESCGMPSLALRALMVCRTIRSKVPDLRYSALFKSWTTRLVTSMMMTHLPSAEAVDARDPAMILWHQLVQQDVELLLSRGVNVDKDEIYRSMQNIMDCLYDVPSSPYFVEPLMHPPMLSGQRSRKKLQSLENSSKEAGKETEEGDTAVIVNSRAKDILNVEGDKCVGISFANDIGFFGVQNHQTKRIAAATAKHGIHYVDWDPIEDHKARKPYVGIYEEVAKQTWPSLSWLTESSVSGRDGDSISMKHMVGTVLKSRPHSNLFLSGSAENCVYLWQYGLSAPSAKYSFIKEETMHRLNWSASGYRFAAITSSGFCSTWDIYSAQNGHYTGLPEWKFQVVNKTGSGVVFVDGSGSVIATSGENDLGKGVLSMWDTLSPTASNRIAHLVQRHGITELATIPGTLILLTAQETGSIQAHDFRMLGQSEPTPLWTLNSIHDGPVTSLDVWWAPSTSRKGWELTLATGGRDGDICLINDLQISGQLRKRLQKAHWKKSNQLANLIMTSLKGSAGNIFTSHSGTDRIRPDSAVGVPVMDLDWCDEGLLTSGADGFVQLFPFIR